MTPQFTEIRSDAKVKNGLYRQFPLTATIKAGERNKLIDLKISDGKAFECVEIGGQFTTLTDIGVSPAIDIVDNGVCPFNIYLKDSGDYNFTAQPVPADMWLAPGRKKSDRASNVLTAPASNPIYKNNPFPYVLDNTLNIYVDNMSNVDQQIWITLYGYYGDVV